MSKAVLVVMRLGDENAFDKAAIVMRQLCEEFGFSVWVEQMDGDHRYFNLRVAQYLVSADPGCIVVSSAGQEEIVEPVPQRNRAEDDRVVVPAYERATLGRRLSRRVRDADGCTILPEDEFDILVIVGGDGTLLHTVKHINGKVPPIFGLSCGSLGFLMSFECESFLCDFERWSSGVYPIVNRCRLAVSFVKDYVPKNAGQFGYVTEPQDGECVMMTPGQESVPVLNEVVVERDLGGVCHLCISVDDVATCVVYGDGLIVATSTGSTAYNMSAGGSLVHPEVPCICITPVCPHSMVSRPVIVPVTKKVSVSVCPTARSPCTVSCDGGIVGKMFIGSTVHIVKHLHDVPGTLCGMNYDCKRVCSHFFKGENVV